MNTLNTLTAKLCAASINHEIDPYKTVMPKLTEKLDETQWCMSPAMISLYGTPAWDALSEEQRKRLSFYEIINLFSFTVHAEKTQVAWLTRRLYSAELLEVTPYLHHFLAEENSHMVYFGGFCQQYAGKLYPPSALFAAAASREYSPEIDDFLFFTKILIFEELGDAYNVRIATDPTVAQLVRDINMSHHKDEARHLAFGREIVRDLFLKRSPSWSAQTLAEVRGYIRDYIVASWWEFYNVRVYKDAGLSGDLIEMREEAFEHEACRAHRQAVTANVTRYLLETGVLEAPPDLG